MRLAGRRLPVESVMESNLEDQGSDEEDETETETVSSHNGRMSATDKMQQRVRLHTVSFASHAVSLLYVQK